MPALLLCVFLSGAGALAAGDYHTCAVLSGGVIKCWGYNSNGQLGTGDTSTRYSPTAVVGLGSGACADNIFNTTT